MVRVAKKLMEKAGKEGKPWISGLFDYRVTPQSGAPTSDVYTFPLKHMQKRKKLILLGGRAPAAPPPPPPDPPMERIGVIRYISVANGSTHSHVFITVLIYTLNPKNVL